MFLFLSEKSGFSLIILQNPKILQIPQRAN